MKKMSVLAVAVLVLLPAAVPAADGIRPGMWEITSTMEVPGMPMGMPPTTVKQCYTKDDVNAMQRKPDSARRLALAYLSIGEAEDDRHCWNKVRVERAPFQVQSVAPATTSSAQPPADLRETVCIPRLGAPGLAIARERALAGRHDALA